MQWFLAMLSRVISEGEIGATNERKLKTYCTKFYTGDNNVNQQYLSFEAKLSILYQIKVALHKLKQPTINTLKEMIIAATLVGAKLTCEVTDEKENPYVLKLINLEACWGMSRSQLLKLEKDHLRLIDFQPSASTAFYEYLYYNKTPTMLEEILEETQDYLNREALFTIFPEQALTEVLFKLQGISCLNTITNHTLKKHIMKHILDLHIKKLAYQIDLYPSQTNNEFLSTVKGMRNCLAQLSQEGFIQLIERIKCFTNNIKEQIQLTPIPPDTLGQVFLKSISKLFGADQSSKQESKDGSIQGTISTNCHMIEEYDPNAKQTQNSNDPLLEDWEITHTSPRHAK